MTRASPTRDTLVAALKRLGFATNMDLYRETGTSRNNIAAALAPDIAAGTIRIERQQRSGCGKPVLVYRLTEGTPAPTGNPGASPRSSGTRTCLCCGQPFRSAHAGNRICGICSGSAARHATPFDVPASVRYR